MEVTALFSLKEGKPSYLLFQLTIKHRREYIVKSIETN